MYKIEIFHSADKSLRRINSKDRAAIAKAIDNLSENPRPFGYKKLKDNELYRIRIGNYRVIYQIFDDRLLIIVIRIGHRREIYKR
jgi:mRNA interferase RelE/StbE